MSETLNDYDGVLPCGGEGTRLETINPTNIPKSLFKVAGKELIRYSVDTLPAQLVERLIFAVGYKADVVKEWVVAADLQHAVEFSEQTKPGVLEAIVSASHKVQADSMIACNTDEVRVGFDLEEVLRFHEGQGTLVTMVTTYSSGLSRHRLIETNDNGIVTGSRLKPEKYKDKPEQVGLVNTGFLVIDKRALEHFDAAHSHDWGGIIDPLTDAGQLSAFINPHLRYFNVGTPEEHYEAEHFLKQYS